MPDSNDTDDGPGERPTRSTAAGGAEVDKSGERPTRSTAAGGAEVDKSGERPTRSTAAGGAEVDVIDKKVKDLLDAATQRELETWFKLPSFDQVADHAPVVEDAELVEVRERRAKACAAVDPLLLELIRVRTEVVPETLLHNDFHVAIHVDPSITQFDNDMAERGHQLAEPREVEITEELRDDLKDCTPQALLRDLHRPELMFEKLFEVVDVAAEQKLDIVAEVDAAMKMNLKLPPLGLSPFEEERRLLQEDRKTRRRPWTELRTSGGPQ